jgi:colicin import membrane protein
LKKDANMKQLMGWILLATLCCAPVAHAGLFGESAEEKEARVAKHVADVLREPNKVIASAQEAVEKGDVEEGIRLFRKAQTMIEEVERNEDTSGSAFATLRLKKFHCVSMLDALALKQSEVQDVRQTVTNTSELAARLAQERAELAAQMEAEKAEPVEMRPPTLADQLAIEEGKVLVARSEMERRQTELNAAKRALTAAENDFKEVAKTHADADAKFFMAEQNYRAAEGEQKSAAELAPLKQTLDVAQANLAEEKEILALTKEAVAKAKGEVATAEEALAVAKTTLAEAERPVEVLRKAIAEEAEAARKKAAAEKAAAEAEKKRLAAETLKRKQEAAAAEAKERERAAKEKAARDAQAKAQAEADAKALKREVAMCEELWKLKRVEAFEEHVSEALAKWPESPELLVQLARLRLIQGEEDDALELVSLVTNKGEMGKRAAFVAAGAYVVKGQALEAMKVREPILEAFPNDPDVY